MELHGVFISHSHADWLLAGRIYDYLKAEGLHPFLDAEEMKSGNFPDALTRQINGAPYFLLLLTKNTFKRINKQNCWIRREIQLALESEKNSNTKSIILVAEKNFKWPRRLPKDIADVKNRHYHTIYRETFISEMSKICSRDIQRDNLAGLIDWRLQNNLLRNTYVSSRENIEKTIAKSSNRFGTELIQCIEQGKEFKGDNIVKSVKMACYAASLLLYPSADKVDPKAQKLGIFEIFMELLKDPDFELEIIITAPRSFATEDAITNKKLGNRALESNQQEIFIGPYGSIHHLIKENEIFKNAYKTKRFRFLVTDSVLPYALFQIEYKDGFAKNDHIKIDLYSEGITSSVDRRCMLFFKDTDADNYNFFEGRYNYIRNFEKSEKLISEHHDDWIDEWEKLTE